MHVASASTSIVLSAVQVLRVGRVFRVPLRCFRPCFWRYVSCVRRVLFDSPLPQRPSSHKMTTPLYPNKCKQWLKADGALEKWKPKDAGQMSFVVFQLKAKKRVCARNMQPSLSSFVLSVTCLLDIAP